MKTGPEFDPARRSKLSTLCLSVTVSILGIGLGFWMGMEPEPGEGNTSRSPRLLVASPLDVPQPTASETSALASARLVIEIAKAEDEETGPPNTRPTDASQSLVGAAISATASASVSATTSRPGVLWQVVGEPTRELRPAIGSYRPERTPISVDLETFDEIEAGDSVSLWIPSAGEFEFDLERMEQLWNGDRTYRGYLAGEENSFHPLTLTVGERMMLATISTPAGNYSMSYDVVAGAGWVMQHDFDQELIDPALSDAPVPDGEGNDSASPLDDENETEGVSAASEGLTNGADQ